MSAARKLIEEISAHGGKLSLNGDKMKVAAPAPLSDELLARLRAAKEDIRRELAKHHAVDEAAPVVMTVPAGDDPFETAAEIIRVSRAKATPGRRYQFRLVDQREADRLNAEAARNHSTDRYCRCGHLATFAWPDDAGRDRWICAECLPPMGRA